MMYLVHQYLITERKGEKDEAETSEVEAVLNDLLDSIDSALGKFKAK